MSTQQMFIKLVLCAWTRFRCQAYGSDYCWPNPFPQGTYSQVGESDTKHVIKQLIICTEVLTSETKQSIGSPREGCSEEGPFRPKLKTE